MVTHHCDEKLRLFTKLVTLPRAFMLTICVVNLLSSLVAILGNVLVIRALWKITSIPVTLKTLFISLAVSDLAVGLIVQPMYSGIIAAMLNKSFNGSQSFDFLCPTLITVYLFVIVAFSATSFWLITTIALDRLLAVSLHLRYQELVTPRRVVVAVVLSWTTSAVAASTFISLPSQNDMVVVLVGFIGVLLTSAAYLQIYRVVRHHQSQIQSQCQVENDPSVNVARVKKSALNTFYMYIVFIGCYVPTVCSIILMQAYDSVHISVLISYSLTILIVLFNSSLNPFIYCWRYREIRKIVKRTVMKIFVNVQSV